MGGGWCLDVVMGGVVGFGSGGLGAGNFKGMLLLRWSSVRSGWQASINP